MKYTLLCILIHFVGTVNSQDTISIVAVDENTGEVGSAAASCADLDDFPGYPNDFVGQLFPGLGAVNTQAIYNTNNQFMTRRRMFAGDTPDEIIQWMMDHDANFRPDLRQYGVASIINGEAQAAAFSGNAVEGIKGHLIGKNYAIQGNSMSSLTILNNMETNFNSFDGDLAEKLMAALQGANTLGADKRCISNATSSLFAFLKIAYPEDEFRDPSFVISVKTQPGDGIEPIDSLQVLFDQRYRRRILGLTHLDKSVKIFPNPFQSELNVITSKHGKFNAVLYDTSGTLHRKWRFEHSHNIDLSDLSKGIYIIHIYDQMYSYRYRVIKS